jgi:hypothetical protein
MTQSLAHRNGLCLDIREISGGKSVLRKSSGVLTQSASDALCFGHASASQAIEALSPNVLGGACSIGAFHREVIGQEGYRQIANWTHALPKSSTDLAMDAFKGGPYHRWVGHHPVDLAKMWLHGEVEILPAIRHLSLDVITTNGLPTLPESVHTALRDVGVPYETIVEWSHLNAFDVAVGAVGIADGTYSLALAITGHLDWGTQTFVFTFGQGAAEMVAGAMTQNPLLVAAGAMHVTSGTISMWQHWYAPDPTIFDHMLAGLESAGFGMGLSAALRLGFVWNETSLKDKALIATESSAISAAACFLSQLSTSLAPLASVGYSLGKMAWQLAASDSSYWNEQNLSSRLSFDLAINEMTRSGDMEGLARLKSFLSSQRQHAAVLAPKYLNSHDWILKPQPGTEHILAKTAAWRTHVADPRTEVLPTEQEKKILGAPSEAAIAFKPLSIPR